MTEAAEQLEAMEVPAGGIGEFVKTDEEIEALEREEANLEFGNDGIAYFNEIAGKMAGYGRFGDDSIAHIETGEIVVPKALIENNPRLKEQIFAELREAGIEDPEQYVVGSKANSINPETGLMEFGFLKKIFKGVGKVFKKIGKFLKKTASIVLPIVLAGFGMPVGLAGMFGSGIGTLIQGGNLKDALKSSLLSGLTAGVLKGAGSAFKGGTFGEGFRGAFDTGGQGFFGKQGFIEKALNINPEKIATDATAYGLDGKPIDTIDSSGLLNEIKDEAILGLEPASGANLDALLAEKGVSPELIRSLNEGAKRKILEGTVAGTPLNLQDLQKAGVSQEFIAGVEKAPSVETLVKQTTDLPPPETFGTSEQLIDPNKMDQFAKNIAADELKQGVTRSATDQAATESIADILRSDRKMFGAGSKFREIMFPGKDASFIRRFGPGALLATGIMGATGGFKVPEQEDPGLFPRDEFGNPITGASMIRQDPGAFLVADIGDLYLDPQTGTYKRKRRRDDTLVSEMLRARTPEQGPMMAADGGDVEYPRRFGGIMPEEGIPDEDSVPALLMPGEFVMTVPAVKGMGDGDLTTGISRMYDVMSRLEKRGRQVA